MIRYACCLISVICLSLAFTVNADEASSVDSLMNQLDKVISERAVYLQKRQERITGLKAALRQTEEDTARFVLLGALIDEYTPINTDSAFAASMMRESVARRIGDPTFIANARMNRANTLCNTGMYMEALNLMDSIPLNTLPEYLHPYYFHIKRTVYGLLADYSAFEPERNRYNTLTDMYRDSLLAVNDPGSLAYVITRADQLNSRGRPQEAINTIEEFKANNTLSEHDKAICAWSLSESYAGLGDSANQKKQLIISAISDMRSAIREYVSLRQLALLLYQEGDLDRAYRFMTISVDDAAKCNARQRIIELNAHYPMINGIYVDTIRSQQDTLIRSLIVITVLSLFLLAALLYMRKQMKRIASARKAIEDANARLRQSNEELCIANQAIAENSQLKEFYIGRYMDQCLAYIEKLDTYRKQLGKLVLAGKTDDIKKALKSTDIVDDELKSFYDNFDRTFLSLFPTFVDDFNSLLADGEAIHPKREGSLTTELRIFALIRLGISDSDKIAKFLHYSLTTIYNYRTKIRNKASGDRNELEAKVLKIGRTNID